MYPEHRFSDLADSLRNGFLLDDIVLALARAEKGESLGEEERGVLEKAVSMLQSAETGYHWLDKPELTSETSSCAMLFARAVSALPAIHETDAFLENISDLQATASQLSKGGSPPPTEKIQLLRAFFHNTSRSELDRTDQLVGEGSVDVRRWTVIEE